MTQLVTLFGGGGFIGRYVAQELLKAGARVRLAGRDPKRAWFIKPLGGLGQTQLAVADITRRDTLDRVVAGSDAVINLVGVLAGNFQAIHVDGARNVAEAARDSGAGALVHVSAIGADAVAESGYARSKGAGEAAVQAAFPSATILRPSIVFGPEDAFINRFAGLIRALPVVPVIRGETRFQPIFARDVAGAIARAALDPARYGGRTFELGGPEVLSMADINHRIADATGHRPAFVPVPDAAARMLARLGGWAPGAPITWDQWLMLQTDNVVAPDAAGLAAFDIAPTPLAAVAQGWLVQYRRNGRFAKAPA